MSLLWVNFYQPFRLQLVSNSLSDPAGVVESAGAYVHSGEWTKLWKLLDPGYGDDHMWWEVCNFQRRMAELVDMEAYYFRTIRQST